MKNIKRRYVMYPAWEYKQEIADINALSDKGWQLKKGGCFRSVFYWDETARYRYALDYNSRIDDPARYRDTFAEQGWEFVSDTFNGWHFFRKRYDPSLPPEEYEIYTDEQSVQDMAGRWSRLGYAFGAIELAMTAANGLVTLRRLSVTGIAITLACLMLGIVLVTGAWRIRHPGVAGKPRKSLRWCFSTVFSLLALGMLFGVLRYYQSSFSEYVYDPSAPPWTWEMSVPLPDFYTLEAEADTDAMVKITVTNKDGVVLAEMGGGGDLRAKETMFLLPGKYEVTVQYAEGTEPGATGMFRFEVG